MLRRILIAALISGFIAGIGISILQEFTTTPIIFHAEQGADPDNADKALPWEACGRAVSVTISKLALLSIL